MFCEHCGKEISDESAFCEYCGQPVGANVPPASPNLPPQMPPAPVPAAKSGNKALPIILAVIAVLVIGGIILGTVLFLRGRKPKIQDNGIQSESVLEESTPDLQEVSKEVQSINFDGDLLTPEETDRFRKRAEEISEKYGCAIYLETVKEETVNQFDTMSDYAQARYETGDFAEDCLLLLVSPESQSWLVRMYGAPGENDIIYQGQQNISSAFGDFQENGWAAGVESCLNECEAVLAAAAEQSSEVSEETPPPEESSETAVSSEAESCIAPESFEEVSSAPEFSEETAGGIDAEFWEGDWYGVLMLTNAQGEGYVDEIEDFFMRIKMEDADSGRLQMWNRFCTEKQIIVNASFDLTEGETGKGRLLTSEAWFAGNEDIWFDVDPGTGFSANYENLACFSGFFKDDKGSFEYTFFLRPWGTGWEDIEKDQPHLVPKFYYEQYLPLIEAEKPMPRTFIK